MARFGKSATIKLNGGGQPKNQLRAPLERLFEDMAIALGVDVAMIGEMSLATLGVRPDYAVDVAGARVGYVELKAPGRGVPTTWTPNKHEKTQWDKLRLLPNVLYTDGALWALYRDGELVGQVARLNGDVRTAGSRRPREIGSTRSTSWRSASASGAGNFSGSAGKMSTSTRGLSKSSRYSSASVASCGSSAPRRTTQSAQPRCLSSASTP
ncbi:hypothetical protein GCM10010404_70730 [Nonomuraea africana]|uniref:YqaJ viral recombinase domain-containing protein n=1 Tax=Nonomuraea africana TaxID=46171 RepID=A0ABR9KPG8_9ACTN|nr:hypothetical protein [Nonomuraea africana]